MKAVCKYIILSTEKPGNERMEVKSKLLDVIHGRPLSKQPILITVCVRRKKDIDHNKRMISDYIISEHIKWVSRNCRCFMCPKKQTAITISD